MRGPVRFSQAAASPGVRRRAAPSAAPVVQRFGLRDVGSALWSFGSRAVSAAVNNPRISIPLGLLAAGGLAYAAFGRGSGVRRREGQLDVADLPADQLWRAYVNPKDFRQAESEEARGLDPGRIYDRDKSPGYQASLVRAVNEELTFAGGHLGRRVDFAEYTRLHDLVSEGLTKRGLGAIDTRDTARAPSSGQRLYWDGSAYTPVYPGDDAYRRYRETHPEVPETAFPVNDWNDERTPIAADLLDESIGGRPLAYLGVGGPGRPPVRVPGRAASG